MIYSIPFSWYFNIHSGQNREIFWAPGRKLLGIAPTLDVFFLKIAKKTMLHHPEATAFR